MIAIKPIRIVHIALLFSIVLSAAAFAGSNGLLLKGEENYYVTEPMSGGSDDNITIEFSVILFFIEMIASLLFIFSKMNLFEYIFDNVIYLVQILLLFVIEEGSILNTIIYDHNIGLVIWILSFVTLVCLTQVFYFSEPRKKER